MAIPIFPILAIGSASYMFAQSFPPVQRATAYPFNKLWRNEITPVGNALALHRRGIVDDEELDTELGSTGLNENRIEWLRRTTDRLLSLTELIALYRRGVTELEDLYIEADKIGWSESDVDYMLRITEVIPSAGDIIRYAVREVYSPEIAEAFGQYEELPAVLEQAKDDIKATGLSETTFSKEWAAHWLLPSILQGFEMLHRGVIPAKSTPETPLSLERLMVALDIMPAWRDKLTAISYAPYTRVDVRRMHKIGVLTDEDVFTAYADVGFSPFAPDCIHETVAQAYACERCRHESKAGRMLNFTIRYNAEPPQAEETANDEVKAKERDLTKSDILTGLRDGLLDESEATKSLNSLGYDKDEVGYYLAKVDFQRDKDELSDTTRYLHDAYIKGVITFANVTDELGKLNLPSKMTEYYQKVWDLERIARTNKPTKAELLTFLRKKIIDKETWHTEMVGLGYPDRYINWYAQTV